MSEENLENLFPMSGKWTSKIGELEDIEHDGLSALEGKAYGTLAQILKRPRRDQGSETND
jgi:hypothetical protein